MTPPRIAVLTGAGVSAGSGVPTFRDAAGSLWRQYNPQDLATPEAFDRDPELVWEFYDWRRQIMVDCQPNAAHETLAAMDAVLPEFTLVTQNIDGLHPLAGSERVLYVHGDIWNLRCTTCSYSEENRQTPLDPLPPICPQCGKMLRPDVVWFGEALDMDILLKSSKAFAEADIALVIGTSAVVYPAAQLPINTLDNGGKLYEFNMERTPLSDMATATFLGPSEETLPRWWDERLQEWGL